MRFQAQNSSHFASRTYFLSEDALFSVKARKTLCGTESTSNKQSGTGDQIPQRAHDRINNCQAAFCLQGLEAQGQVATPPQVLSWLLMLMALKTDKPPHDGGTVLLDSLGGQAWTFILGTLCSLLQRGVSHQEEPPGQVPCFKKTDNKPTSHSYTVHGSPVFLGIP